MYYIEDIQAIDGKDAYDRPIKIFVDGDPQGKLPTNLNAKWFNISQEELINLMSHHNYPLEKDNNAQLVELLRAYSPLGETKSISLFNILKKIKDEDKYEINPAVDPTRRKINYIENGMKKIKYEWNRKNVWCDGRIVPYIGTDDNLYEKPTKEPKLTTLPPDPETEPPTILEVRSHVCNENLNFEIKEFDVPKDAGGGNKKYKFKVMPIINKDGTVMRSIETKQNSIEDAVATINKVAFDKLKTTQGKNDITQTIEQMPNHTHPYKQKWWSASSNIKAENNTKGYQVAVFTSITQPEIPAKTIGTGGGQSMNIRGNSFITIFCMVIN